MYTVTLGDALTVLGAFGINMDYTVRLKLRLRDKIDDEILKGAVDKTRQRYKEFSESAGGKWNPLPASAAGETRQCRVHRAGNRIINGSGRYVF